MNFSSVVSFHTNPMTCGVAKFGAELARRLGTAFVGTDQVADWGSHPLFSFKASELPQHPNEPLMRTFRFGLVPRYSVFWHDTGIKSITDGATNVFYADPSLGSPGLWCPSLITPRKRPVRLFSFGMAHKLQTDKYKRVRELLDAASIRYHLRVSVGLHEGTSLDGAEKHFDALKEIMGEDHVTILGILSDDAVSEELANADYVLAFFEKGLRANNTTVHAAHLAGCSIITNHDADTPKNLRDATINVDTMLWPPSATPYTWDNLIEAMRKECERSRSTVAQ